MRQHQHKAYVVSSIFPHRVFDDDTLWHNYCCIWTRLWVYRSHKSLNGSIIDRDYSPYFSVGFLRRLADILISQIFWQDYLGEILAWVVCLTIYFPHWVFEMMTVDILLFFGLKVLGRTMSYHGSTPYFFPLSFEEFTWY
jgi:hypothetical protein